MKLDIGDLLIAYRIEHGMTRVELAKRLGISTTSMRAIEKGIHGAKVETLQRISQVLGIPPSVLAQRVVISKNHRKEEANVDTN